jgi:L,D-transpeptidase catalytic domain
MFVIPVSVKSLLLQPSLLASLLLSLGMSQPIAAALPNSTDTIVSTGRSLRPIVIQPLDLPPLGTSASYLPELDMTIRLHLRLGERRVYVYQGDQVVASYAVAIGRSNTPTPLGEYAVFQMIENPVWQSPWTGEVGKPGADSALGLRWIGFVTVAGGVIGFHGTPTLNSIGQAASHGCVRMSNEDVVQLFDQVEIDTPVIVEP